MSKQDSSSDNDKKTESDDDSKTGLPETEPDAARSDGDGGKGQPTSAATPANAGDDSAAVQADDAEGRDEAESTNRDKAESTGEVDAEQTAVEIVEPAPVVDESAQSSSARPWLGLFNLLLILALATAAGYFWRQQQRLDASYQADLAELRQQLAAKASSSSLKSSLQSGLAPLKDELGELDSKVEELGQGQQSLRESSEKLYELYGRDKNDWQLAEVEYLMRVAQHKLILQNDFEGAAITLQAASDRSGLTGDPGLLPVRVKISEEIAELKTRERPDLVGMTLKLAQLGRQVRSLQPGFALRVDEAMAPAPATDKLPADDWLGRFNAFINSLVTVRRESTRPTEIEANVVDVADALEDNLKLARWAVLERNPAQYDLLLERSLRLFREFYDLDNAANHDFMTRLQELQKMVIKPEKPDITGSLRELQRILSQRENAPPAAEPAGEPNDG